MRAGAAAGGVSPTSPGLRTRERMIQEEYAFVRRQAVRSLAGGVLLVLAGIAWLRAPLGVLAPFVAAAGAWIAARAVTRLIRLWAVAQTPGSARPAGPPEDIPRRVFRLLFAVAEADGRAEAEERELVRRFLLERFPDPLTAADLREWEARRPPPRQVASLARSLRDVLDPAERETLFYWSCLVAFVDRRFRDGEHEALQQVARGLGIESHHARRIFHHAKARFLGETESAAGGSARARALAILGLGEGATREQIHKRHRELVKKLHPDRHQHLGPAAAEEAASRFREVQQAYELLTGR